VPQAAQMQDMFDLIAKRYDLVNRITSCGRDTVWRRAVAREVSQDNPRLVLDNCCGTAHQARILLEEKNFHGTVAGADISWNMLSLGAQRVTGRYLPLQSDAHHLALKEGTFDCVTICFGVRNLNNISEGLREMARVLRPGGKIVILEFTRPANRFLWVFYRTYLFGVLPLIAGILSGQRNAYRYLASSIEGFLTPAQLGARLTRAGFTHVEHRFFSLGVVAITTARKTL